MRLFAKKGTTRSTTAVANSSQRTKNAGPIDDNDLLRAGFENLFSDNCEENYVEAPSITIQDAKKHSILQDSSPISLSNSISDAIVSGPPLKTTRTETQKRLAVGKRTPESTNSVVTPMFPGSSRKKPPKFSQKRDIAIHSSPISLLEKPPTPQEVGRPPLEECFEPGDGDDEFFMVEEATQRDFNNVSGVRCELDLDLGEELVRSSATFKWKGRKEAGSVEMSAEEILSSHHLNLARSSIRPPSLPCRSPSLASRPPMLPFRPPPLLPNSPSPQSVNSTVFGQDGGFSTGGFTITSAGMVSQPKFALREDLEVNSRSQVDLTPGPLSMKDLKEFRQGPTIGAGAAGRVYLALHEPTSTAVAMKTVNVFDAQKRQQLLKELKTLSMHVSRYLVRFYGAFYDGSGAVHIALEFMDRGCLDSFVKKFGAIPERIVQMIAMDCLRGLRFLHKQRVLHRDFKTANILLSRAQCCAKVSDFGLARDLHPGKSMVDTFVGTVAYMSPERLNGSGYTYASDIWALGVSLVECLLGRYPFDRPQNYFEHLETTSTSNLLDGAELIEMSEKAKSFIGLCTDTDPHKRPTAEQLLEHVWLRNWKRDTVLLGEWMDECASKSISMSSLG